MRSSRQREAEEATGAGTALLPLLGLGLPWNLFQGINPYRLDALPEVAWRAITLVG